MLDVSRGIKRHNIGKKRVNSFNPFMMGPLSYRNQSIDLQSKSVDWSLYDNGLRLERVKTKIKGNFIFYVALKSGNIGCHATDTNLAPPLFL